MTTELWNVFPTNTKTTSEKIERIRYCEDYILKNTSCSIVKVRDLKKYAIIEVDKLDELLNNDKYSKINAELTKQGFKKVALNLSPIDDDEFIKIDYCNNSFSYRITNDTYDLYLAVKNNSLPLKIRAQQFEESSNVIK